MRGECAKTGKILASFVDPRQAFGPDKIIPPQILSNAKGLAILTVFKAGFLGTARFGSGVVVARLADGSWSAPSAIGTVGGGFGGQIGFELTDFVFILNDANAVRTFAQAGSLTLGGNVSIAAGPVGRNAEAAGAASLKSVAGVFSYSKTKGLFAGVSLEGSAIIERRDANEKLYGRRWTARELLSGQVPVPPAAEPLMRVLNSRVFAGVAGAQNNDGMYNDIPVYDDAHEDVVWQGRKGNAFGEGVRSNRTGSVGQDDEYVYRDKPTRASTWQDDVYDRTPAQGGAGGGLNRSFTTRANPDETFDRFESRTRARSGAGFDDDFNKQKPGRPTAPKPVFGAKKAGLGADQAIAKFTFEPDQAGDLGFKKGEVITILKRTDNETDWWTGRIGDREGIFPSNYVETV
jgi:lipid-binding SYLF domain-containing protein